MQLSFWLNTGNTLLIKHKFRSFRRVILVEIRDARCMHITHRKANVYRLNCIFYIYTKSN